MEADHQTVLLQEYRGCDNQVTRIDTLIWQTASVIFPITLAGFAYFGSSTTHTPSQFSIICAVGIGSITLLVTWYLLSRQWYAYQAIAFYRMREIEAELGMYHYRYSLYMRRNNNDKRIKLVAEMSGAWDEKEKSRFQNLDAYMKKFPRVGLRTAIAAMTLVFALGWVGLLIREFILVF